MVLRMYRRSKRYIRNQTDACGGDSLHVCVIYEHIIGSGTFNEVNNAIENAVGLQLQFKGNGMKVRICDTVGLIDFYVQFD